MHHKLLIVGGGSFATEVEELAWLVGYEEIAFLDDNAERALAYPVIGCMQDLEKHRSQYDHAIVALCNNSNRMRYHEKLESLHFILAFH